jgi:GR25 family glycosyltransferase involved in LPS biosynthesis
MQIKPIMLYLPEPEFAERMANGREYFKEQGIGDIAEVWGVHAAKFGVTITNPYKGENQNQNEKVISKNTGSFLSHYTIYNVCNNIDSEYFLILEDDARFVDGWQDKLGKALDDVPRDFDVLFVGCCYYGGKPTEHVKGNVYEVKYPLCGHCYIVAKKAISTFLETQRNAALPTDMNLAAVTFPKLKVYTILPRLSFQEGVEGDG